MYGVFYQRLQRKGRNQGIFQSIGNLFPVVQAFLKTDLLDRDIGQNQIKLIGQCNKRFLLLKVALRREPRDSVIREISRLLTAFARQLMDSSVL